MYDDKLEITLRPIDIKDAEVLMELNNNTQISDYVVGTPTFVTVNQQIEWMKKIKNEKNTKRWMICFKGEAVGTVILSSVDLVNSVANVNIKILPAFHGMGIAKCALNMICDIAFDELGIYCLTANVLSYNEKSKQLFQKVGFRIDGVLRSRVVKKDKRYDLITLSLLKTERSNH